MNKEQIAQKVADATDSTKKDSLAQIDAFLEIIEATLIAGEEVSLVNFGKFSTKIRKERVGRNPQTQAEMIIEAQKGVRFQVGKGLKENVKKSK